MRHYYDAEFTHIMDHHQDDIMQVIRGTHEDDFFDTVEKFLYGHISEYELVCKIKDLILDSAETVCENHNT